MLRDSMLPKNVYKQTRYAAKTAGKKPAILWCKLWHEKTTEITMISVVVYNLYIKDAARSIQNQNPAQRSAEVVNEAQSARAVLILRGGATE